MKENKTFTSRVLEYVGQIPKGETRTYAQVAAASGNAKASRAVGNILKKNYNPSIPCHRVIHSDGRIGRYNRGDSKKLLLLKSEGAL